MPSGGRDIAVAIRLQKPTRQVPLVFVGGQTAKVERIRTILPDATYTTWGSIGGALEHAIANPPMDPVIPRSRMAGYEGTALPKKLGIKEGSVVAVVDAPDGFERGLSRLAPGARIGKEGAGPRDLTIWFVRSRDRLKNDIRDVARRAGDRPLWVAWPKKSAKTGSDLTQQLVREGGLGAGLVDYKVCSIDETWSGLLFRRR
jgi:hypothetical protein